MSGEIGAAEYRFPGLPDSLNFSVVVDEVRLVELVAQGKRKAGGAPGIAGSGSFAEGCALCLPSGPRAMAAYGQLAGAWYGFEAIPAAWRRSLARVELLQKAAESLLKS